MNRDADRSPGEGPPDNDLEWRLHAMLDARAERLDPQLHGPRLRASAARRPSTIRRVAPALAAAATVAAIGLGIAVITTGHPAPDRTPVQPGGGGVSSASTSTVRPVPRPTSPAVTPSNTFGGSVVVRPGRAIATPHGSTVPATTRPTADRSGPRSTRGSHRSDGSAPSAGSRPSVSRTR